MRTSLHFLLLIFASAGAASGMDFETARAPATGADGGAVSVAFTPGRLTGPELRADPTPWRPPSPARRYRRAGERGAASAQYRLGLLYDDGRGVLRDDREAVRWYRRAAKQGHIEAQNDLGVMLAQGEGVERDYVAAVEWFRRAAERGHALAQFNLGLRYTKGQGVEKDHAAAVGWYRKAAASGNADAQNNLGIAYGAGRGVERDLIAAHMWFGVAAENGHEMGARNRRVIEAALDAAAIAKARRRAARCRSLNYSGCD